MNPYEKSVRAQARREAKAGQVPDPREVRGDIASWVAAQGGLSRVEEVPVLLMGCREGILIAYQAKLGNGLPAWVFQKLDEKFLKKLVDPFASVYREWLYARPWVTPFAEAIPRLEKELAGDREPTRIEGVASILVDSETMLPIRSVFVGDVFIRELSRGNALAAAPLVAQGSDGAAIVLLYETAPGRNIMRAEKIPDAELEQLGLAAEGPPVAELLTRLIKHVQEKFHSTLR